MESASESENDAFLLLDSTGDGVDVEDRVITRTLDASKSESKPTYLTERANGSGDYAKEKVITTNSGWVFTLS